MVSNVHFTIKYIGNTNQQLEKYNRIREFSTLLLLRIYVFGTLSHSSSSHGIITILTLFVLSQFTFLIFADPSPI